MRRRKDRIDYYQLHTKGIITRKRSSEQVDDTELSQLVEELSLNDSKMEAIVVEMETFWEDISDYLQENVLSSSLRIDDIDKLIGRICELRSNYRKKVKEAQRCMEDFDSRYGKSHEKLMESIKCYINEANDLKHKHRVQDYVSAQEKKLNGEKRLRFMLDGVNRSLDELELQLEVELDELSDDEIQLKNDEFPEMRKKLIAVNTKISQLADKDGGEADDTMQRYEIIYKLMSSFEKDLKSLVVKREIGKEKLFKESKLNIKLGKFKDFDSCLDIYTFQDDFEKLYLRTIPKRLLPDMLKNNHLDNPALLTVKSVDDIDEIWARLKQRYGDPKIMLAKKLEQINNLDNVWKYKNCEKISDCLNKIINLLKDLLKLAKKHRIEAKLFHGDALDRIYQKIGDVRVTKWLDDTCDDELENEALWNKLIEFLEKESKIQQKKMLLWHKTETFERTRDDKKPERGGRVHHAAQDVERKENLQCSICDATGHFSVSGNDGTKLIQYFACEKFALMTPQQRFNSLKNKGLCFQCLLPGALSWEGKHRYGNCLKEFACQHPEHDKYTRKKHVLVCEEHKDTDLNKELLQKYKEKCILRHRSAALPDFSKNIQLTFYYKTESTSATKRLKESRNEDTINDHGIYQLQTIQIKGQSYNIFYDTGCADFVSKKSAIDRIGERAALECEGPMTIGGVGNLKMTTPHGIYTVRLPLRNGGDALMTGMCLEEITATFPAYPLKGKVTDDIKKAYHSEGGNVKDLPKLPAVVGGSVDFMIGIKYLRYHPKQIFQLPSGLTIYESVFAGIDGNGVIGGPHELFSEIERQLNFSSGYNQMTYFSEQLKLYQQGFDVNPDISKLGFSNDCFYNFDGNLDIHLNKCIKQHNDCEEAGTLISYRCVKCRNCVDCKNHDALEEVSIREEIEQDLINKSVIVDEANRVTVASLPFTHDPNARLTPNRHKALKVLRQQVKKLNKSPKDRLDVVTSEGKLQSLGHVEYVSNLTIEQQEMLDRNTVKNYIPWRSVWKVNSLSTPCRLVFDASQPTDSGYSLNDIIAKGRNNMNRLQEILIRWFGHQVGFHTDIHKMYNSVKLIPNEWCFQRYLWVDELDPAGEVHEKVIKTLIYGVK